MATNVIIFIAAITYHILGCYATCLRKPSFVSSWIQIIAQDNRLSEINIKHNLGEIPVKVDVQVKPINDNGTADDFMFPGIGSAQRDDDINETYAGVVYFYNETSVTLIVPNKHDGTDLGKVVYTGGNIWRGPSPQESTRGLVRVRVWRRADFPEADFESNWIRVSSGTEKGTFLLIPHNLGMLPEYASIQLRSVDSCSISDGVGSGLGFHKPNKEASWGGVLYGYDRHEFRIWLPSDPTGSLFSADDGWGHSNQRWNSGEIRARAWKVLSKDKNIKTYDVDTENKAETLHFVFPNNVSIDTQDDILEFLVIPQNGSNQNFNFKGSGAAQNTGSHQKGYGGLVYSYTEDEYRLYHPPFKNGSLLDISDIWGHGKFSQTTNNVKLKLQIWRSETSCKISKTRRLLRVNNDYTENCKGIEASSNKEQSEGGISAGAAAGIAIGILAVLLGSSFFLIWALWKRKQRQKVESMDGVEEENKDIDQDEAK